ncbi:hypothetical protein QTI33_09000 [Variovorax sp. J22P271]|uniref:hypothetical protein n=1 Tax=Variovorax davisae TaxID=3053515 RepID=UPI0025782F7E|nr:hypothetical protein [Variovorax sp. J22P271]MDM0032264.1 hypothetical protein [Variovorax sp. J22P271]
MIHPFFKTALKHPDLVVRHLANYMALLRCEAKDAGKGLLIQISAGVVAVISLLLALGLTGVAVMLGFLYGRFHWVLALVPALAWLCALTSGFMAVRSRVPQDVKDVREEVELDLRALRLAKDFNEARSV